MLQLFGLVFQNNFDVAVFDLLANCRNGHDSKISKFGISHKKSLTSTKFLAFVEMKVFTFSLPIFQVQLLESEGVGDQVIEPNVLISGSLVKLRK